MATNESIPIPERLAEFAEACGYPMVRMLPDRPGFYGAVFPMLFTHAIILGRVSDHIGYEDRWCYRTEEAACEALEAWDGAGEPEGWHRHPSSGRRREEGDPGRETFCL